MKRKKNKNLVGQDTTTQTTDIRRVKYSVSLILQQGPYLQKEPGPYEDVWASTLKRKCSLNNHSTKQKSVISFGLSLCETKEICSEDSAQIIKNGMSINLLNDHWTGLGTTGQGGNGPQTCKYLGYTRELES